MKKFFSLVLALVMALSLTTVAWGAIADTDAAKIGDTGYATLSAAVTSATAGDEIVLLKDVVDGVGIVINKKLTIDFDGHTYTFASDPVGSTGTKSQGFQILKEATAVTLKNGTLTSKAGSGVKMLVQNYCDLTLDGMELLGTNLDGGGKYVLSNNAGDVVIEDTTITAAADGVAFDSYDYSAGGYTTPPTVTVKGTSVVNGKVESAGGELVVEAGTFNGEIAVTNTDDVSIKGGTFSTDVSDYVVANSGLVYQNGVYTTTTFVGNTSTLKVADGYAVYELNGGLGTNSATATFTKIVTGNATAADGTVTYTATQYKADNGTVWNEVDVTIADSKLVNTKTGTVVAYLKYAGTSGTKGATSVVATSMIKAPAGTPVCGQYAVDVVMIKGQAYAVDKTATSGQWAVLNGKFITYGAAQTAKPHVFTKVNEVNKDGTPANVKCDDCKVVFAVTKDVSAMVSGYMSLGTVAPSYYALIGSTTPVVGGTTTGPVVNSADTFDAGIAMYVGMSVMAAAGSAVVIGKKKD